MTQQCPRRDCIGTAGQADTTVGLVLARGREMPCSTKVELFGANARQGKETVHLVGNHMSWWDDKAGDHRLWLWGWTWLLLLSATHLNKDNDNGCFDRKLIKCLMDSADDLSSLLACTHYLYVGNYEYGLLRVVVSFESSERHLVQHCGTVGSRRWRWNSPSSH